MEDFAKYYNNLKNNINKIYNQYEVDNYTKKLNSYVEQLLNIAKENKLDIFLIDIEYYSDTMYILNKILKSIESKKDTLDSKEKEIYESLKKEMLDFMDSNEKLINEHIDNKTEKNYYDFEETQNIINDAAKKYEEYAKQLLEFAEKNNIKILND